MIIPNEAVIYFPSGTLTRAQLDGGGELQDSAPWTATNRCLPDTLSRGRARKARASASRLPLLIARTWRSPAAAARCLAPGLVCAQPKNSRENALDSTSAHRVAFSMTAAQERAGEDPLEKLTQD
ncbi:unnamed protein product [Pleuronectes platessa]|uniref:Uncharacterized protein n=1 Tax=Pleuronectes platessa TaxID=8262 RepID=A0A9N7U3T5_PLEPL|nr:unnamed protein product [Pleuronectes platessa]